MKKPLTMPDEPQPRNITRADLVMVYDAAEKELLELSPTE